MAEKNGGPAFPTATMAGRILGGMSLRDYFAAAALQGILAGGFADTVPHDDVRGGRDAAFFAYQYADAMLAARDTQKEEQP
jgi:hypothetical protein